MTGKKVKRHAPMPLPKFREDPTVTASIDTVYRFRSARN